jgi:adenylate cyclase class IV
VHITIDTIDGLGTFAEVEVLAADEQAATAAVETHLKGLGLDGAMRISMSYLEMALAVGAAAVQSE